MMLFTVGEHYENNSWIISRVLPRLAGGRRRLSQGNQRQGSRVGAAGYVAAARPGGGEQEHSSGISGGQQPQYRENQRWPSRHDRRSGSESAVWYQGRRGTIAGWKSGPD